MACRECHCVDDEASKYGECFCLCHSRRMDMAIARSLEGKLCSDCPPAEYPDAPTRCLPCPRRRTMDANY